MPESQPVAYGFDGVELDLANRRLRIDGQVRDCPSRVLELLFLLCSHPGTLLRRDFLIARLWPGGQEVSDATLAKLLFNTRNLLGTYGDHIRTVRGQGLRLDAPVTRIARPGPVMAPDSGATLPIALEPSGNPEPASTESVHDSTGLRGNPPFSKSPMTWRQHWITGPRLGIMVVIAAAFALSVAFLRVYPSVRVIDEGYAMTGRDIAALEPDTANLIQKAFKSDENGERDRAIAMLEAIHRHDEGTPVPALFLALWQGAGAGMQQVGKSWLAEAELRLESIPDIYLNLLHDYVAAEINGTPEQVIYQAGALLGIRAEAWRMRAARAHLMEFAGMRKAALNEIQQIQIKGFAGRKYNLLIADRAAFGDVEGAQHTLDSIPPETNPVEHAFLSGRVAWSRGDFSAAEDHFLQAGDLAYNQARLDLYRRCLIYVSAIDVMMNQDESAIASLQLARNAKGDKSLIDEIDVALFLAQLSHEHGRDEDMRTELEKALQGAKHTSGDQIGLASYFAALRLDPQSLSAMPGNFSAEAAALWRAMDAFTRGDRVTSRQHLAESLALGIDATRMSDEARWLQLQLGLPVAEEQVLDPPYPPLSRVVLRRQIRHALAQERTESPDHSSQAITMRE